MNVAVLGLGYIGLPTAAMLADAGHDVVGVDVNERLVRDIASGCGHLDEVEVRQLVARALASGKLRVQTLLPAASEAYIICVPTPTRAHRPDLRYVEEAAAQVAPRLRDGDLLILESTVPPGTVDNVIVPALEAAGKVLDRVHIAHCPERVIPGAIVRELRHNARIVGGRRPADADMARDLYASFCEGEICITDCMTAELVKVVENTFRDVNLAFANELALLAEALGADAWEVIRLANNHPRVNVLNPGPGVGGHCIPVDPTFLSNANPFLTDLIQTARRVNERMPHVVARTVDELLHPARAGTKIAVLGAAYKANVDDTRESPAAALLHLLTERRHATSVYDPLVREFNHPLAATVEDAVRDADAIVLITDHAAFKDIDPFVLAPLVRRRLLVDTRNFFDREVWNAAGFTVRTLGIGQRATALEAPRTA